MYGNTALVHTVHMAKAATRPRVTPRFRRQYGRTFIRDWRQFRELTLERLAERVGITHASLSRIERGLQPYNQVILEKIAEELQTDTASLLMRNPRDPAAIWSIWEQAQPGQRRQIIEVAQALLRTGSGD